MFAPNRTGDGGELHLPQCAHCELLIEQEPHKVEPNQFGVPPGIYHQYCADKLFLDASRMMLILARS